MEWMTHASHTHPHLTFQGVEATSEATPAKRGVDDGGANITRTYQAEWSYNLGLKGYAWDKTESDLRPPTFQSGTMNLLGGAYCRGSPATIRGRNGDYDP